MFYLLSTDSIRPKELEWNILNVYVIMYNLFVLGTGILCNPLIEKRQISSCKVLVTILCLNKIPR